MSRSTMGQVFMRRKARVVMAAVLALGFMASIGVTDAHATDSQATLIITNATRTATVGTSVTLTSSGGSGTGDLSFAVTTVTGSGCSISGSTVTASAAATCSVVATKAASGTYAAISSPALRFWFITASAALLPQTPLRISNTTRSGATTDTITLTTTGGSGTGAITYAYAGTGCSITSAVLSVSQATVCSVVATKAADSTYASVSSTALLFKFSTVSTLLTQDPLRISNTTRSALTSETITLTTSGGSGTGTVSYSYSGTGCSLSTSTTLAASQATICTVTATKAADSTYASATSPSLYFRFTVGTTMLTQLPLTVSNTSRSATVGSTITLTSTGGLGTGVVTFAVAGTYCSITSGVLSASQAATCLVTATKPSDGTYASKTSPALQFRFNAA